MGREFELKYRATEAALEAIRARFGEFDTVQMETAYYDTSRGDLRRLHWTLRRRYENGISVCTVKTPAPGGGRGEWEVCCPEILTAIPDLVAQGAPAQLAELTGDGLSQVCAARFTRLARTLDLPGATAELALDRGVLLGGGKEQPFAEVEVELKSGSEAAVTAFAQMLAKEFGLEPECRSKQQRALTLAGY